MKKTLCYATILFLSVGCHAKKKGASHVEDSFLPTGPTVVSACALFDADILIDRRVSHQEMTIRGGSLVQITGYGVQPEPGVFSPLPLDRWYEISVFNGNCWSAPELHYFSSNPATPEEPPVVVIVPAPVPPVIPVPPIPEPPKTPDVPKVPVPPTPDVPSNPKPDVPNIPSNPCMPDVPSTCRKD